MIVRELVNKVGFKVDKASLRNAERGFDKLINKARQVGTRMTAAVTLPFVGFVTAAIRAQSKQAQALAQVESALISTSNAVGKSFEELQEQASRLQEETLFGDETILQGVTAQLLTFTNVTGKTFGRAQRAIVDMTNRMRGANAGVEALTGVSIQLGKVLNNPVKNLSALGRAGVEFSKQQIKVIKQLAETNRLAEAQAIILKEIEKEFGGAAKASRKASFGFRSLFNVIGDVLEDFGKTLLPFFQKFNKRLEILIKDLNQRLSPSMKFTIILVGALVAAIGPLLLAFAALSFIMKSISLKMVLMALPFLIIIGLIALLIDDFLIFKKGGDSLIGHLLSKFDGLIEKIKEGTKFFRILFEGFIDDVKDLFSGFWDFILGIFSDNTEQATEGLKKFIKSLLSILGTLGAALIEILRRMIPPILQVLSDLWDDIKRIAMNIALSISNAIWDTIVGGLTKAFVGIKNLISKIPGLGILKTGLSNIAKFTPLSTSPFSPTGVNPALLGAGAGGGTKNINNFNINSRITLPVPEGTPSAQIEALDRTARLAVQEEWNRNIRQLTTAMPETE